MPWGAPTFEQSLAGVAPAVAAEWHPSRNAPLTPRDVRPGSDMRVWWRCRKCGHEWATKIGNRVRRGQGCGKCAVELRNNAQRTPRPGGSLAELEPALAVEWHPTKNLNLRPIDVVPGSTRRAWWLCAECGFEWETVVRQRARKGAGCPQCFNCRRGSIRSVPKTGESIADVAPELAVQWNAKRNGELLPSQVKPGSNKKVWWVCPEGHEWQVSPAGRSRGEGCPVCGQRKSATTRATPKRGQSLADLYPDVALDWHPTLNAPTTPHDVNPGSKQQRWWLCRVCGHEWITTCDKRAKRGDGCRNCSPIGVSARELRVAHELAAVGFDVDHSHPAIPVPGRQPVRADIVVPSLRLVIEYDGVRFHADFEERDRRQTAALEAAGWEVVRVREHGLPSLGGLEVFVSPWEPVKTAVVALLEFMEREGWSILSLAEYRDDPEPWAEEDARKAIHKHRAISLASENPSLASELDPAKNGGIGPDQIHPRSGTKFLWTCSECAHEWVTTVSIRARGHGCPKCGYRRVGEKVSSARRQRSK